MPWLSTRPAVLAAVLAVTCQSPAPTAPARPLSPPAVSTAPADAGHVGHPDDPGQLLFSMGPCTPDGVPLGAVPPAPRPAWCATLPPGTPSARSSENGWVDAFEGQNATTGLPSTYRVFEAARAAASTVWRTKHFIHNGHWMVDAASKGTPPDQYFGDARDLIQGLSWGGGFMRPDRSFTAVNGTLVVEADVSASMAAYRDGAWPEIVITTAAAPTGVEVDPLHASGLFGGAATVGCQLYPDRKPVCLIHGANGVHYHQGGLRAELSASRDAGAERQTGGAPTAPELAAAWRTCARDVADATCRDRFRLEVSRDSVRLFVNGTLYMEHAGLPESALPPRQLLADEVYVYFASWIYFPEAELARMHWGRIAVNP